jgi:hypothetical protein
LQWIQRLIVDADREKTLTIAPPILSRVYNQLGNGIVYLSQCRALNDIPIPFPFVHALTVLLLLQSILTPVMLAASVENAFWAAFDCFLVVACFWLMNYIAMELEYPFGAGANNLPSHVLQKRLNRSLTSLLHARAMVPPDFDYEAAPKNRIFVHDVNLGSILNAVNDMRDTSILNNAVNVALNEDPDDEIPNGLAKPALVRCHSTGHNLEIDLVTEKNRLAMAKTFSEQTHEDTDMDLGDDLCVDLGIIDYTCIATLDCEAAPKMTPQTSDKKGRERKTVKSPRSQVEQGIAHIPPSTPPLSHRGKLTPDGKLCQSHSSRTQPVGC